MKARASVSRFHQLITGRLAKNQRFCRFLRPADDCRSQVPNPLLASGGDTSHEARPSPVPAWSIACICATPQPVAHVLRPFMSPTPVCSGDGLIALHARDKAVKCSESFVAALCGRLGCHVHQMQVSWCTNEPARQHYGTRDPGPARGLRVVFALASAASDHRWSLLGPPANPPGPIRSAVASQRSDERQRCLFHSCSRSGCKKSPDMWA